MGEQESRRCHPGLGKGQAVQGQAHQVRKPQGEEGSRGVLAARVIQRVRHQGGLEGGGRADREPLPQFGGRAVMRGVDLLPLTRHSVWVGSRFCHCCTEHTVSAQQTPSHSSSILITLQGGQEPQVGSHWDASRSLAGRTLILFHGARLEHNKARALTCDTGVGLPGNRR